MSFGRGEGLPGQSWAEGRSLIWTELNNGSRNVSMKMRHLFEQFSVATQPPVRLNCRRQAG